METFVVRVWTPADREEVVGGSLVLHGVVEHAGSGRQQRFRSDTELLTLLRGRLETRARDSTDAAKGGTR